eukprot:GEMP01093379.1.p1 GENE.GEMP01093379.1~~GEMP01093379.1.p1  ORF type:complete len:248 (+),score=37.17 GEMP01093379.1:39-782(+)
MSLGYFEWCVENEALGPLLESVAARSALVLGCGTSRVEHLLRWTSRLHCVDNDEVAIREQAQRLAHQKNITFEVCDLCVPGALSHLGKQQCLIDKGTLDFMLCQDPLKSSEMLANVHSVTELGGSYVILTIHPEELIQGILAVYGFKHLSERRIQFNGCVGMVWVKETVRGQRASRETGRSMTREHVGKRYGTGKEEQKNNTRMVTGEAWRRETYSRLYVMILKVRTHSNGAFFVIHKMQCRCWCRV